MDLGIGQPYRHHPVGIQLALDRGPGTVIVFSQQHYLGCVQQKSQKSHFSG
jgi:hypothetical protein